MKLWQKEKQVSTTSVEKKIEEFTIGNDRHWDLLLAAADIRASLAHATMLRAVNLLTEDDFENIKKGLNDIATYIEQGTFVIDDGVEDMHSQIELLLTESIGEAGKKIHSARSRNDQSLTAIKLFIKDEIKTIAAGIEQLFYTIGRLSEEHQNDLLPGYTHLQMAMPSSFGLWFGAYTEGLSDDLELLIAAYNIANKNPLGSAAGYGSSLPIDRDLTTTLLDFGGMNYNAVYAQMTRGKTEKTMAVAMAGVAATLSKLSMDVCLFMNQNFDFIAFPDELTTGSSIMPHKKNPDVFELIRAKCNRIQALPNELTMLINNLPSGYQRDMQLTKECLFPAIQELKSCLEMMNFMLGHIQVKKNILEDEKYNFLFTVESVNKMVLSGASFREAYREIGRQVESGTYKPDKELNHTHKGSIGNLCNQEITTIFEQKIRHILT